MKLKSVAQVSKPAVSPISKSAGRARSNDLRVWKPAIQQTWKSALRQKRPGGLFHSQLNFET
jgi:hypothetical protein